MPQQANFLKIVRKYFDLIIQNVYLESKNVAKCVFFLTCHPFFSLLGRNVFPYKTAENFTALVYLFFDQIINNFRLEGLENISQSKVSNMLLVLKLRHCTVLALVLKKGNT